MTKRKLEIQDFEDKRGAHGRYTRFKTNEGWMSCFAGPVSEKLKDACDKKVAVVVEVAEKEGDGKTFVNITKIYEGEEAVADDFGAPVEKITDEKISYQERSKQAGVSLRYAVDLCIGGRIELADVETYAGNILFGMRKLAKL